MTSLSHESDTSSLRNLCCIHTASFLILILAPLFRVKELTMDVSSYLKALFGNDWYFSNDVSDATKVLENLSEIPATEKETAIKIDCFAKHIPWQNNAKADSAKILD